MTTREFGQYSLVSYVHALRGERVNVGIAVWHPRLGAIFKSLDDLKRVACLDYDADLGHVTQNLDQIRAAVESSDTHRSPLPDLAQQFRFDVVVSPPQNARVSDVSFLAERLWDSLIGPSRPPKQMGERVREDRFRKDFAGFVKNATGQLGLDDVRVNFTEEESDKPVDIAASFNHQGNRFLWRVAALIDASGNKGGVVTKAKAVMGENGLLRKLGKYKDFRLNLAVKVRRREDVKNWEEVSGWLHLNSDSIVVIDERHPLARLDANRLVA